MANQISEAGEQLGHCSGMLTAELLDEFFVCDRRPGKSDQLAAGLSVGPLARDRSELGSGIHDNGAV